MDKSNTTTMNTKYKLAFSMKELMKKQSLEKITIKDITTPCSVTRQTFYRNFEDKYALVNWYFEILVQNSFVEMNEKKTLLAALERKFIFIQEEIVFFKAAFKTQSYNSLIEYDYRYILNFYTKIIEEKTNKPLTDDVAFALELYCKGSIYKTVEWVEKENKPSPAEMANLLVCALPPILKDLMLNFE